jgi:hypothetical protein
MHNRCRGHINIALESNWNFFVTGEWWLVTGCQFVWLWPTGSSRRPHEAPLSHGVAWARTRAGWALEGALFGLVLLSVCGFLRRRFFNIWWGSNGGGAFSLLSNSGQPPITLPSSHLTSLVPCQLLLCVCCAIAASMRSVAVWAGSGGDFNGAIKFSIQFTVNRISLRGGQPKYYFNQLAVPRIFFNFLAVAMLFACLGRFSQFWPVLGLFWPVLA